MKNDECTIKIHGKNGRLYQSYRREKAGWVQISSRGIARPCTAEQLLSHLLPPLAGASPSIVKVERDAISGIRKTEDTGEKK
jgi:hypothetical protein